MDYNFRDYEHIYASRKVIKNRFINKNSWKQGYYGSDDFRRLVDEFLRPYMCKGMTIYGEIVGYTTENKMIQKDFDYGCVPMSIGEAYTEGKHYKIYIYRITLTNVDGIKYEFSAREVQNWCKLRGLRPVNELYYGYAKDLYPELSTTEHWAENFLDKLANDKERFWMEERSPECVNNVPHEGIVIRNEDGHSIAVKLKTFKFLNKEQKDLDSGQTNIEDES
jgi:hypothetical protein